MVLPRPGQWVTAAGRWLIWERLYDIRRNEPTVWCRVRFRYLFTAVENAKRLVVRDAGLRSPHE